MVAFKKDFFGADCSAGGIACCVTHFGVLNDVVPSQKSKLKSQKEGQPIF